MNYFCTAIKQKWSVRLGVRTPGFHPGNRGSIPLRTTFLFITTEINRIMANHKSALKRIRQNEKLRVHNRYYSVTMRNAVSKLRSTENKEEASAMYPKVSSLIDGLAKRNIIHANKAANLKSKLAKHIAKL